MFFLYFIISFFYNSYNPYNQESKLIEIFKYKNISCLSPLQKEYLIFLCCFFGWNVIYHMFQTIPQILIKTLLLHCYIDLQNLSKIHELSKKIFEIRNETDCKKIYQKDLFYFTFFMCFSLDMWFSIFEFLVCFYGIKHYDYFKQQVIESRGFQKIVKEVKNMNYHNVLTILQNEFKKLIK